MTKINVRELSRNTKEITERARAGEYFKVYKNNEFVFSIVPEEVNVPLEQTQLTEHNKYALFINNLKSLQGQAGDTEISNKIDEIVYAFKD